MIRNLLFLFLAASLVIGCHHSVDKGFFDRFDTVPINCATEVAKAKAENKLLLLEFGSSDSCAPCQRFEREVFSQPEFLDYAGSNLVFVRVDFPFYTDLSSNVLATNTCLMAQYNVGGFPTFIALNPKGDEIWRLPQTNDLDPNFERLMAPKAFISQMNTLKNNRQ